MKKYIILSVNDNPEYLFYLPLTVWAWRKFGWEPIIFKPSTSIKNNLFILANKTIIEQSGQPPIHQYILQWPEYASGMLAQISRLYAGCVEIGYLMTGDVDMIPLSDYWKNIDENEITVWGHDLTSYQHYPICYIGMPTNRWIEVMGLTSKMYSELIKRDLDSMPNAKSYEHVKRWVVDQDLITERLNATRFKRISIDRGMYPNGYPIGRVDRSAWTLHHPQLIDCHMPRGIWRLESERIKMFALLLTVWPREDWNWFLDYIEEFKRISNE